MMMTLAGLLVWWKKLSVITFAGIQHLTTNSLYRQFLSNPKGHTAFTIIKT